MTSGTPLELCAGKRDHSSSLVGICILCMRQAKRGATIVAPAVRSATGQWSCDKAVPPPLWQGFARKAAA